MSHQLKNEPASTAPNVRPVEAIITPGLVIAADIGETPKLEWIALTDLVVNGSYQRTLSQRSVTQIRKIVRNFSWERVKALSVVRLADGKYEIVDGQHTAIAAATHGAIGKLPCLVVDGANRTLADNAGSFVGINSNHLAMTPLQIFWANIAAQDEDCLDVLAGCRQAECLVLPTPKAAGSYRAGETIAVSALERLAKEGGPIYVKRVMSVSRRGRMAPVRAIFIRALADLFWGELADGAPSDEAITDVLRLHGSDALHRRAGQLREDNRLPMRRCLALTIARMA